MNELAFTLPAEAVEAIAQRAAEVVLERLREPSPWMDRKQAAAYLGVPVSRLEKDRDVPCHRWDGRVLYNRATLDEWLLSRT